MSEAQPLTQALAGLEAWLAADQPLPPEVVARAQRLWLDTASCAWAGLQSDPLQAWLHVQAGADAGPVALPGTPVRLAGSAACMAMAIGACWDEACEGLAVAHGRPGLPVVAALWSELARAHARWAQVWRATAVGYEVAGRLGAALRISPGMHVDGVWGAFGAAAAVVTLRGGDWARVMQAVEACASQLPFSLYRPVRQGANVRNTYLGHSAWLGWQAAQAVAAGLAMPKGALDDVAQLALDPAAAGAWIPPGRWLLLESYWKPFAAVRHVHYGAQAAQTLRSRLPEGAPVDELVLTVYPEALQYCGNRAPATVLAAQFSLSFGVAATLVHGDLSPEEFRPPRFDDARVRQLEAQVQIRTDAARFPGATRGAVLALRSGATWWTVEQGAVAGDVGCEPAPEVVQAKFDRFTRHDPVMARWAQTLRDADPQALACLPE